MMCLEIDKMNIFLASLEIKLDMKSYIEQFNRRYNTILTIDDTIFDIKDTIFTIDDKL